LPKEVLEKNRFSVVICCIIHDKLIRKISAFNFCIGSNYIIYCHNWVVQEGKRVRMKELERKLLSELLKNSRRSDRELAKAIGVSQPTTTRLRTKLEKEGYIKEYTIIPNFNKIGYSIMAMNFIKLDPKVTDREVEVFKKSHPEAMGKNPFGLVLIHRGIGLGYDTVIVSFHQDYASYDAFRNHTKRNMGESIIEMNTFLINIEENNTLPPTFSFLSRHMLNPDDKTKK
jgi:DNA-binding Lrp family transcriptional regulator